MPETEDDYTSPLDLLTADFFGGKAPEAYTADTLQEALIRQAVQCHAVMRHELECAVDPLSGGDHSPRGREDAYFRVDSLAGTIKALTSAVQPPSDAALRRHAATLAAKPQAPGGPRWPHEAYLDPQGRFDPELFNDVQSTPDFDLHGSRKLFGYPPFTGQPLEPYRT